MRKRQFYLVMLIIISSFLLFGCNGGSDEDPVYKLTITNDGAGSVQKDPEQSTYKKNSVVTLTAKPGAGWNFDQWKGDLTGTTNPKAIVINGNTNIIAVFTENRQPELNSIGNKQINRYSELKFQVSANDPDGDELTFSATSTDGLAQYFDPVDKVFTWKPGFEDEGDYSITFRVTDGLVEDTETIVITVIPVNGTPEFELLDTEDQPVPEIIEVFEGQSLIYLLVVTDPDGDSWTATATGNLANHFVSPYFTWTPDFEDIGDHVLTITVDDGNGGIVSKTYQITVVDYNFPPVLNLTDQSIRENEQLTFVIEATDADQDPLTYSAGGELQGFFDPSTQTFDWTPGYECAGDYPLTITVSDGINEPVSNTMIIHVLNVNRVPVFNEVTPKLVEETETTTIHLKSFTSDPDGDSLTYSVTFTESGYTIDANTGVFSWTPELGLAGNVYDILFTASDGEFTASKSTQVKVGVNFADPNLESMIKAQVQKDFLYPEDLQGITNINANNRGITTLQGVQYLVDLLGPSFNDNNITSLQPLAGLTKLQSVLVKNNQLTNLEGLPVNAPNFSIIGVDGNHLTSLASLSNFPKLNTITASNNQITSLFDATNLTQLKELDLQNNLISNINPLADLSDTIQTLKLSGNQITNLNPIQEKTGIVELYLANNLLTSITQLAQFYNLEVLDLSNNQITSIDQLHGMYKLDTLYLNGTAISNIEVLRTLADSNLKYVQLKNSPNLDLSEGSAASNVITYLKSKKITVVTE